MLQYSCTNVTGLSSTDRTRWILVVDWSKLKIIEVEIMRKRNFTRLFENRKSHIDSRIRRDYIENGIATVNCCISGYHDVISTYSSKGQESLNFDFIDYLEDSAEPIPDEYPLVLNIIGNCLSEDEKKSITEIIRDDFAYKLGIVEKEQEREFNVLIFIMPLAKKENTTLGVFLYQLVNHLFHQSWWIYLALMGCKGRNTYPLLKVLLRTNLFREKIQVATLFREDGMELLYVNWIA